MTELQAFNEWLQTSGTGYWLATVSSFIWSILYIGLQRKINKQFVMRGELLDHYSKKAVEAKKEEERDAYILAVHILTVEQSNAPRGVIGWVKSWLNAK